ncbi:DEAD/DEAH box helicase [Curtobacterium sp. MCLR17_042]|uniref:SNF2-related protein n=1 Tax=Curtobacterium sp. MCLR17_042 TaxID=2175626 RepID=UPI000DA9AE4C|nr:DEAD/DEAH box helicase [Curtobacterium sp. MCLR17_042]PZE28375.1 hypothetical protein DEJ02_07890 [Curtobacterium sp. MCLR17_042]
MSVAPGTVHREGGDLILTAPPEMPDSTWRALQRRLLTEVKAEHEAPQVRQVRWPVENSAPVRLTLSRWPAQNWDWDWTSAADAAATHAEDIAAALARVLDAEEPPPLEFDGTGFTRTLLPAQERAVAALVDAGSGGNFSVPGSGKTTMTYAVYASLRAAGTADRMLVIAPQSAYEAWEEEADACFDHPPVVEVAPRAPRRESEVVVVNYERLASGSLRAALHRWAQRHRLMVVYDEAHRAKRGIAGLHGAAARDVTDLATHRFVLTGTPMPNSEDDLVAVLDLAWPGHGARLAGSQTPNAERSWVRITKDELQLDPAHVVVETVELDRDHRRLYDAVVAGLVDGDGRFVDQGRRAAIMRVLAAAANPLLLGQDDDALLWSTGGPSDRTVEELLDDLRGAARPAKLLAAAAHADRYARAGQKVLIWTNFVGNVAELARLLAPLQPAVVTGATPRDDPAAPTDRVRELRRFREDDDCSVLIATPQTLGEGISLHQVCQAQIHVDRSFNAGLYLQALDRTHRVGMPAGTSAEVTLLVADGTIDEAVDMALREKMRAMDAVLADPTLHRLAEASDAAAADFTEDDIRRLVAHLRF